MHSRSALTHSPWTQRHTMRRLPCALSTKMRCHHTHARKYFHLYPHVDCWIPLHMHHRFVAACVPPHSSCSHLHIYTPPRCCRRQVVDSMHTYTHYTHIARARVTGLITAPWACAATGLCCRVAAALAPSFYPPAQREPPSALACIQLLLLGSQRQRVSVSVSVCLRVPDSLATECAVD